MTTRTLLLALGLVAGAMGAMPTAAGASSPAEGTDDAARAETSRPMDPDTIYVARMEPLLVIGYRIHGTYTGAIPETRARNGNVLLASAAAGERTSGGRRPPAADTEDTGPDGIAAGGLIVDESFSVTGTRFAEAFQSAWVPPEEVANYRYTVRLQERPIPRFSTQVAVEIGDVTIFQRQLRPMSREIEPAAKRAVRRARYYLREYYEPREVY